MKAMFEPLTPGGFRVPNTNFYRAADVGAPADDLEAFGVWAANRIEEMILFEGPETVAAVFLEPVQNSGGCFPPPPGYFQRVREICDQYDVLLVSDEVICAFGRIGHMFACDAYGYVPDMITCAKGMTSGYSPIGATIISEKIYEPFRTGTTSFYHGYTSAGTRCRRRSRSEPRHLRGGGLNERVRENCAALPGRAREAARHPDRRRRSRRRVLLRHRAREGQGDPRDLQRRGVRAPAPRLPLEGALRRRALLPRRRPRRPRDPARAAAHDRRSRVPGDRADPAGRPDRGDRPGGRLQGRATVTVASTSWCPPASDRRVPGRADDRARRAPPDLAVRCPGAPVATAGLRRDRGTERPLGHRAAADEPVQQPGHGELRVGLEGRVDERTGGRAAAERPGEPSGDAHRPRPIGCRRVRDGDDERLECAFDALHVGTHARVAEQEPREEGLGRFPALVRVPASGRVPRPSDSPSGSAVASRRCASSAASRASSPMTGPNATCSIMASRNTGHAARCTSHASISGDRPAAPRASSSAATSGSSASPMTSSRSRSCGRHESGRRVTWSGVGPAQVAAARQSTSSILRREPGSAGGDADEVRRGIRRSRNASDAG